MSRYLPSELVDAALAFLGGLTPAALGAAVSLTFEEGLNWSKRFAQFASGVVISYFAARVVGAIWEPDVFVMQGISFTLGMIAFKAAPRFSAAVADQLADLPGALRDRILPRKRD